MAKPRPDFTWEQLEREREAIKVASIPPDAFTVGQYADKFGIPTSTATTEVKKLVAAGKIERLPFRVKRNGHYSDCYRLKR